MHASASVQGIIDKFSPGTSWRDVQPIGPSPVIISKAQLVTLTPTWLQLSLALKRDPAADRRFGWVLEMWGYSIAAAQHGIKHKVQREWQIERGGNWSKGKSADGYGPVGPWLVTPDEVADPQSLDLWLERNGETMQKGSTADMIFPVTELISYLSQCMSLNVGDIIATGTPAGVGLGRNPPVFLEDGDVLRLGITGLGEQSYRVFADNGS